MKYDEGRGRFINTWGNLATQWGINKTMAQIHACMLLSPEPMTTDDVIEELGISRGNANMNIRALVDWGLVNKVFKKGERKDYYEAIKDSLTIARQIARERRRRELAPVVALLEELSEVEGKGARVEEMRTVGKDMLDLTSQVSSMLGNFADSRPSWWKRALAQLLK